MNEEAREYSPGQLKNFQILGPLQTYHDYQPPASTAELLLCQSDLYPRENLVLKLARPGKNEIIREEAETIQRLHSAHIPYVIKLIAAGPILQKENRFGLIESQASGRPLGIPKTAVAYEVTTHTKVGALRQYLEFLTLAYERADYAKPDHQAEATFWNPEDRKIQVVDFTPSATAKKSEPRFELARRTIPQLVEFFADVFGCSAPNEPDRAIYAVDPNELMPLPILGFYTNLGGLRPSDVQPDHLRALFQGFSDLQQKLTKEDFRKPELTRIELRMLAVRQGLLSSGKTI